MLFQVKPEDLDAVWAFVEQGLAKVIEQCGSSNWTPPDVKRHIQERKAALFICADGFVVLEVEQEAISQKTYMNVWLMWFKPGRARRIKTELVAWLDDMTQRVGGEWWQFGSPREGWAGIEPECERYTTIWRRKRK